MAKKKHVVAVFTNSNSVPQFISDVNALKESLTTPPGSMHVTVPPTDITQLTTDVATLTAAQATADSGEDGTAADRDIAWDVVLTDVRSLVQIVQKAADVAADEATSIAIIQSCGLRVKSRGVFVKPDFAVKLDKVVTGLVHLISKAAPAGTRASYEWQYSANGVTFNTIKITTKSRTEWLSGLAQGTKAYFRKRVITEDVAGAPAWSQVVTIYIV